MKPHIGSKVNFFEFISSCAVKWCEVYIKLCEVYLNCGNIVDESEEWSSQQMFQFKQLERRSLKKSGLLITLHLQRSLFTFIYNHISNIPHNIRANKNYNMCWPDMLGPQWQTCTRFQIKFKYLYLCVCHLCNYTVCYLHQMQLFKSNTIIIM